MAATRTRTRDFQVLRHVSKPGVCEFALKNWLGRSAEIPKSAEAAANLYMNLSPPYLAW